MEYPEYGAWDGNDADTSWPAAVDQFLDRSQHQHQERLAAELGRIEDQLDEREAIHEEIVAELEWQIDRYTDRLDRLHGTGRGKQDGTRDQVRERLATFQRELREERRAHWRDRQELERERRDLLRELAAMENDVLSEFLDGR